MTERRIAGHVFAGTCDDVCLALLPNGEPCLRTWAEIEHATEANANEHNLAHVSYLSVAEAKEIMAEKKRRDEERERMWSAIFAVGSPA